nr:zinc finger, CCHC-type, retrotransposon Gag domain protein [Tanacetum cinerariifolium]
LEHAKKVLSMHEIDEAEPTEVEEVLEVVIASKLMTKVVTTGTTPISAAPIPKVSTSKKRRGVIIQDPEEASTASLTFLRLAGFLGATAGTEEEQAKNFQWGLRKSTLKYLMCMPFTDVAQVANAARNYEILHERDDVDAERLDKRQKSGDRHQPTTQQSSHRNHGHNNDHHGSDRQGGGDNHRSSNNNYSGNNNRSSGNGRDQRNRVSSLTDLPILVSSSPGVPLRATPTRSALRVDADTQESVVELLADKKPGASGRVFAITEDHATKTS